MSENSPILVFNFDGFLTHKIILPSDFKYKDESKNASHHILCNRLQVSGCKYRLQEWGCKFRLHVYHVALPGPIYGSSKEAREKSSCRFELCTSLFFYNLAIH